MSHATGRNGQQLANHYEVMGLAPTASKAQVRARFLKLVRLHHPDKVNGNAGPSSPSSSSSSSLIHQLYAAHEVLCNDDLRAQYDAELAQGRGSGSGSSKASSAAAPPRVSATLDLDSFEAVADDDDNGDPSEPVIFEHPCRCGSKYVVSADDLLVDGFDLVECYGCSEVVRVAWRDKEEGEGDR